MKNSILKNFRLEALSSYSKSKKMFNFFSDFIELNKKITATRNNLYASISFNS
jgi:hypothetical protein